MEYSFLAKESINPTVNSATDTVFLLGAKSTGIPFAVAVSKSILFGSPRVDPIIFKSTFSKTVFLTLSPSQMNISAPISFIFCMRSSSLK